MRFVYNDGGRALAGFKGETQDCVTRAIAIITGEPYRVIYDALNDLAQNEQRRTRKRSSSRTGVSRQTYEAYLLARGFEWVPTMAIGSGCQVHLTNGELPGGRLVARLSKHLTAVIDGVIYDTYDPSREGTRCVYGYYREQTANFRE